MVHRWKLKLPGFVISLVEPCILLLFFKFGCGSTGGGEENRNMTHFSIVGHTSVKSPENENIAYGQTFSPHGDIQRNSSEDITYLHTYNNTFENLEDYDVSSEASEYDDKFVISTQLVIRLAQCRANCVDKFGNAEMVVTHQLSLESKHDSPFSTCWQTCQLLEKEGGTHAAGNGIQMPNVICSLSSKLCLRGCQEACGFHLHQHQNLLSSLASSPGVGAEGGHLRFLPVIAIPVEPSLSMTSKGENGSLIEWPKASDDNYGQHLVYTLVQPSSSSSWEVVGDQVVANHMTVPMVDNPLALRLLAVNSHGLAKVFSHCRESQDKGRAEKKEDLWHLQLNSLVHQKFLVVTEVRWDFPDEKISHHPPKQTETKRRRRRNAAKLISTKDNGRGMSAAEEGSSLPKNGDQQFLAVAEKKKAANFLLTWEVYGGLVRGHLVTEMNVVTVSLWPDTSYIFQVGLIDESLLSLDPGESSITSQMESRLSSGGELPVRLRSNTLSINTSHAEYPLVKKSVQAEWKRSAQELITSSTVLGPSPIVHEINHTRPMDKVGVEQRTRSSNRFCNWNVHSNPNSPTDDQLRACILIWGILIVCLIIIFLMFLYFVVAVYLAMRQQIYFQKLHTTCSVSSIYDPQFYRLRKNIFRKNGHLRNKAALGIDPSSAVELLNFSDTSSSSESEDEEMQPVE